MNAFDTRKPLRVLLLADDKPGHYHQSEGIVRALERIGPVACRRLHVQKRQLVPRAALRAMRRRGASPERLLSVGFGLTRTDISSPDLVVSSGGETMFANAAAAKVSGARNLFLGPVCAEFQHDFDLVISSHEDSNASANHVRTLQPNAMDPHRLGRPDAMPQFTQENPPRTIALLLGGDTRDIRYAPSDWARLGAFMRQAHENWGTRWVVSSSRRTSSEAIGTLAPVLHDKAVVRQFLNYRLAGPSSLPGVLRLADVVVVTADSSAMLSEAIAGRFPVMSVTAADHYLDAAETVYRNYLTENKWATTLPIGGLTSETFLDRLAEVQPRDDNHLEGLAALLRDRLPEVVA